LLTAVAVSLTPSLQYDLCHYKRDISLIVKILNLEAGTGLKKLISHAAADDKTKCKKDLVFTVKGHW
jgi:hypothetical protein